MSYTPVKGSPMPSVPGSNPVEVVLMAVENLAAKIPDGTPYYDEVNTILAAAQAAASTLDPYGQKGAERTKILATLYAEGTAGIPGLVAFATDEPPHPTAWVRRARWMCVDLGAPDPLPGGP